MKRVFTVTSGKGGVGKTNISMNLAAQMAKEGLRTCIFDADLGLANINILLGIMPEYDLEDVVSGEKNLTDILVNDSCGVDIIPGGSGVEKLASMPTESLSDLITSFSDLDGYDVLFFDTSAGIGRDVISFCMASREVVLVIQPEPTSLTDGYSLLKILAHNGYRYPVKVIVNQAKSERYAEIVFTKFKQTVKKYIPLEISYVGSLPADEKVADAVTRQRPFVTLYPTAPASNAIVRLARHLINQSDPAISESSFHAFWERYADIANGPLKLIKKKSSSSTPEPASTPPEEKQTVESKVPENVSEGKDTTSRQILEALNQLVSITKEISETLKENGRSPEEKTKDQPASDLIQPSPQAAKPLPLDVYTDEDDGENINQPICYSVQAQKEHPTKIHILPSIMINKKKKKKRKISMYGIS